MNEREQIRFAIANLETQRAILGDSVVDTAVFTLREKLTDLDAYAESSRRSAQRKQVTILFANVSGFSGITEAIPDTHTLDIMNVLWRRLDGAISRQGGVIDKHMGDAVMGVFGVPTAREDDPERAVRAALGMRVAIREFVAEIESMRELGELPELMNENGRFVAENLTIQIGINTGPVMVGEVGTGDEYTVIGDAVNVASRLERTASPGGILISHETYLLVRDVFDVEPLGPVEIRGRSEPIPVYTVQVLKPRHFYGSGRGVEGVETRMVGRDTELDQLQAALHISLAEQRGQTVAVVGEAGIGKSRLLHEFSNWVAAQAENLVVFKGRTYERTRQLPYTLIRDLFAARFGILDSDPAAVVTEKLLEGMRPFVSGDEQELQKQVQSIAQLIGLEFVEEDTSSLVQLQKTELSERAFRYIAAFFMRVAAAADGVLIFLEDLHWADAGSLDLVEYLTRHCRQSPLLIVCLARPSLFIAPGYAGQHTGLLTAVNRRRPLNFQPDLLIELSTLSDAETEQLVNEILRKLPDIPAELMQLIVTKAEGNPFYVEELIKVLIDDGVLITGGDVWHLQRSQLPELRVPPNITGVIQARLDRLSALERATLQRAAVVGRVFWDTAVMYMNQRGDDPIDEPDTATALLALQKREMIFPRRAAIFTGAQTYTFKHAILHQVAYESVLLRERPLYHKQTADWLTLQSGERLGEYAGVIARHFEMAGEKQPAAELYEMAALRAEDTYQTELATDYYRRSLNLLSDKTHQAVNQLRLQERLGVLLAMQGRLVEAAQAFMTMRFTAVEDGDLVMQARAWLGLAELQQAQGDFDKMLQSVMAAEEVAWLINAEFTLAQTLMLKSHAYLRLGDMELASAAAKRALELSVRADVPELEIDCLQLLCNINLTWGRPDNAAAYMQQLEQRQRQLETLQELDEDDDLLPMVAHNRRALGWLHTQFGRFGQAAFHLLTALRVYRQLDKRQQVAQTLNTLGEAAFFRGSAKKAIPLFREALAVAEAIGDRQGALFYRTYLSQALLMDEVYDLAVAELLPVVQLVDDVSRMVRWRQLPAALSVLALAECGRNQWQPALTAAQRALTVAQHLRDFVLVAVARRALGIVLAASQHTSETAWVQVGDDVVTAVDCLEASVHDLETAVTAGKIHLRREWALSLFAAGQLAALDGDEARRDAMMQQAEAQAVELGIPMHALRLLAF